MKGSLVDHKRATLGVFEMHVTHWQTIIQANWSKVGSLTTFMVCSIYIAASKERLHYVPIFYAKNFPLSIKTFALRCFHFTFRFYNLST